MHGSRNGRRALRGATKLGAALANGGAAPKAITFTRAAPCARVAHGRPNAAARPSSCVAPTAAPLPGTPSICVGSGVAYHATRCKLRSSTRRRRPRTSPSLPLIASLPGCGSKMSAVSRRLASAKEAPRRVGEYTVPRGFHVPGAGRRRLLSPDPLSHYL